MNKVSRFLTGFIPAAESSDGKKNYNEYVPGINELMLYFGVSSCLLFSAAYLFYRNFVISLFCIVFSLPLLRLYLTFKTSRQKELLLDSFRDVLYSLSASVAAGRQMPMALEDSCIGLKGDVKDEILAIVTVYNEAHADIGLMLEDLGRRSGLEEIRQFADSYMICKKCGADLESVCLKSASLLLDRIEYGNEVKTLVAQKRLDIALLTAMPVAVLLILNLIAFSYIRVLYETAAGRLVMTLCLLLIVSALIWALKITDLKL